jgi:CubicO group peptidase (beta-lactamase class C family)
VRRHAVEELAEAAYIQLLHVLILKEAAVAEQLADVEAVNSTLVELDNRLEPIFALVRHNWLHEVERQVSKWSDSTLPDEERRRCEKIADCLCIEAIKFPVAVQTSVLCLAGSCYRAAGKTEQALAAYQDALKVSPENERAIFLLTDLKYVAGGNQEDPPVEAYLKSEMASDHIPGLSVGVVQNGKLVLAHGYGLANIESDERATKETVYEIASITKTFTATAIMMLVEEGKIELDQPISRYLSHPPAWNNAWSNITVRQLLTHTSGIPNFKDLEGFADWMGKDDLLKGVASRKLEFDPGAQSSYSNTGYLLLGLIIESVSRKPFGTFLQERIFEPLGMAATRVNDPNESTRNRACGYQAIHNEINDTYHSDKLPAWHPRGTFASGCLVSTVEDLLKWDAALYTEKLLTKSSLEQMWIPAVLKSEGTGQYGFGWEVGKHRGHGYIGHGGRTQGFGGYMMRFVCDRLTVILLTNSNWKYENQLFSLVAGIARYYLPAPIPSKTAT